MAQRRTNAKRRFSYGRWMETHRWRRASEKRIDGPGTAQFQSRSVTVRAGSSARAPSMSDHVFGTSGSATPNLPPRTRRRPGSGRRAFLAREAAPHDGDRRTSPQGGATPSRFGRLEWRGKPQLSVPEASRGTIRLTRIVRKRGARGDARRTLSSNDHEDATTWER
jgi:hypothetical protein